MINMNVLLDFITVQWRTGAGEYQRRVVHSLIQRCNEESAKVKLFALYDSHYGVAYDDLQVDELNKIYPILFMDIRETSLTSIIQNNKIDKFFIACGQYIGQFKEVEYLNCEVICVIHDLSYEEMTSNRLDTYLKLLEPKYQRGIGAWLRLVKYFYSLCTKSTSKDSLDGMYDLKFLIGLLNKNSKARCIVVSEYTKMSMVYNYSLPADRIDVLYTPLRQMPETKPIENGNLKRLLESGDKFYLAVSCNRRSKNPEKLIRAFMRYSEYDKEANLVLVSYPRMIKHPRIVNLNFLSDSDLAHALKSCYALVYPSFFEGFGLPPLEAMRYGKPILASNTTSIPEVLQEAPIYFSPIYESAIFEAFMKLGKDNYEEYVISSKRRITEIQAKQEADLVVLIDMILEEKI